MGITLSPPNVNEGEASFKVATEGRIHFGLAAIKGVGLKAIDAIVKARDEGGPFASLDDFFERVSIAIVTQASVETLIKAGAFDFLGARRSQLLAVLPRAAQAGQARQDDLKRGQRNLFDLFSDDNGKSNGQANGNGNGRHASLTASLGLPDVPELPDVELLAEEKKALGFYMSSHPLTQYADLLKSFRSHQVAELAGVGEKIEVVLGGMIESVQVRNVKKSRSGLTRMAKLTFEDLSARPRRCSGPKSSPRTSRSFKPTPSFSSKGR